MGAWVRGCVGVWVLAAWVWVLVLGGGGRGGSQRGGLRKLTMTEFGRTDGDGPERLLVLARCPRSTINDQRRQRRRLG